MVKLNFVFQSEEFSHQQRDQLSTVNEHKRQLQLEAHEHKRNLQLEIHKLNR